MPLAKWSVARRVAALFGLLAGASGGRAASLLLEAEKLEAPGGWQSTQEPNAAPGFLVAPPRGSIAPAAGAIVLPHAGRWRLWVRSKDFPHDRPGIRHFTVRLGTQRSAVVFGRHGRDGLGGWEWEDGGWFELPAGPALVVIGESHTGSARCDALLLSDDPAFAPKGLPAQIKAQPATTTPLEAKLDEGAGAILPPPLSSVGGPVAATLANDRLRIAFRGATSSAGPAITMEAACRTGTGWQPVTGNPGAEGYRVLVRPIDARPHLPAGQVFPSWDIGFSPTVVYGAGGASVQSRLGPSTAPWASARCFASRPIRALQVDARTVVLEFPPLAAGRLTARWHLPGDRSEAQLSLEFTPSAPGWVSLGYHGLVALPPGEADFLLLPLMYHGKRFPAQPVLLQNAQTPTPIALVQKAGIAYALVAEPAEIPFEWPAADNSRFALGLRNESGLAQPLIYSPVLGQPGSEAAGRHVVRARFRVRIESGDWYRAYQAVAQEDFNLRDYRQPVTASLSDAALNLLDLLRDEKSAGWNVRAKGPWNIESRNVVTHASPLTYLSFYLLTGDPAIYERFARPALEFLLSRPSPHFAAEREIGSNYYRHQAMRGPIPAYGAAVFAGAYEMTHGLTPAFGEACFDEGGRARLTRSNSHIQPFEDALALFRLTGEARWRDEAIASADRYIAANLTRLPSKDLGPVPFVNVSFLPDWEGLLHLYESTAERRFLDAAAEGARWLVTTLWTQPLIPDAGTTIHAHNQYVSAARVWWKGDKRYRMGFVEGDQQPADELAKFDLPPARLPEKRVPAWQVSQVGLGAEQPSTYSRVGHCAPITMNTWAPNLLRLAALTGDATFRTAARNATIGRFGNYPGYYLDGFTDWHQRTDYPQTGPDVTWLYVHHIPPFAAYVLDYLFTDVEVRSHGAVTFPSVRQCGYVWFDNRLRGHAPGRVYSDPAWPWLHRTAATVDNVLIDRVLAHGAGKFHVVLLNQSTGSQRVRVGFDAKALGRSLAGAEVTLRSGGACPTNHNADRCRGHEAGTRPTRHRHNHNRPDPDRHPDSSDATPGKADPTDSRSLATHSRRRHKPRSVGDDSGGTRSTTGPLCLRRSRARPAAPGHAHPRIHSDRPVGVR